MAKRKVVEPKLDHTTVVANLHIVLTDEETAQRAHDCADFTAQLSKSEDEFKAEKKTWTDKHKELKTNIKELSIAAMTGREYRETECEQYFDLKAKRTWYEFGGERYEERDMTEYEVAQIKQGSVLKDNANVETAAGVTHSKPDDNNDTAVVDDPVFNKPLEAVGDAPL